MSEVLLPAALLALRLAAALRFVWQRGQHSEGLLWLRRALAWGEGGSPAARAKALNGASLLARQLGHDYEAARGYGAAALELWQEVNDLNGIAESLYHVGMQGNRILFALAEVIVGWLHLRAAVVALKNKGERPEDGAFYDGKVATARWWCKNVLPGVSLTKRFVEESSLELMDLSDEAF